MQKTGYVRSIKIRKGRFNLAAEGGAVSFQRKPPSGDTTPTLPRQPHFCSSLSRCRGRPLPRSVRFVRGIEVECRSTSLLPRLLVALAFVCTSNKLLVLESLFVISLKLRRFVLEVEARLSVLVRRPPSSAGFPGITGKSRAVGVGRRCGVLCVRWASGLLLAWAVCGRAGGAGDVSIASAWKLRWFLETAGR